jgi:hypothetical protein
MEVQPMIDHRKLSKPALPLFACFIMATVVFFSATPRLKADDVDRCQRRIVHAEHEFHEAVERHGRNSRQAEHERRELHEARERCWREHHRWWDEHEHRWRTERDWDERDHDRY